MILDIHCHTNRHSRCSRIDPVLLVRQAERKGIEGLIITDHHYLWSDSELEALRKDSEINPNFLILSAQEVDTDIGHVLVFGAPSGIHEKTTVASLRDSFPDAALVFAHPWRSGKIPEDAILENENIDAVEIFSTNHSLIENYHALSTWHRLKFTATAGSDAHRLGRVGSMPTIFDHAVSSISEVAAEIRHGRCRPHYKEKNVSGKSSFVIRIAIGPKGIDEERSRIILRGARTGTSWDKIKRDAAIMKKISKHGFRSGPFRIPSILHYAEPERLIFEQGQRGRPLNELLLSSAAATARDHFIKAAQWLARFHSVRIHAGSITETKAFEHQRLTAYLAKFTDTRNRFEDAARKHLSFISTCEDRYFLHEHKRFVVCHGDYQLHNILIGQDKALDPTTQFVSAVDFESALLFLPACDIGCFLAQFRFQMNAVPDIRRICTEDLFLQAYAAARPDALPQDKEIAVFKLRSAMSIADFLIKVGKGTTEKMEQAMALSDKWYRAAVELNSTK